MQPPVAAPPAEWSEKLHNRRSRIELIEKAKVPK
jgi:hypothetical protein